MNILVIIGLLIDIIGSFFILKTFFSLAKRGPGSVRAIRDKINLGVDKKPSAEEFVYYNDLGNSSWTEILHMGAKQRELDSKISFKQGSKEELESYKKLYTILEGAKKNQINAKESSKQNLINFYQRLGRDAVWGFAFLCIGFSLQILGQIFEPYAQIEFIKGMYANLQKSLE